MDPRQRIDEISRGFMHSAVFLTACNLGLFDALGAEALGAAEMAGRLGLDARALETVLLALASEGILLREGEAFRIAPEFLPYLLSASDQTQINILNHNYHIMRRWVRLDEVLRSGRPIPREEGDPAQLRAFICGMADISRGSSREVAEKFDLAPFRRMLDLGGGPGTAAITFAQKNPGLECVVFDLPGPLAIAREQIAAAGLEGRVTTHPGDYFTDDLGTAYDLVYISNIIHSMGPADTARLVEKSRRALAPGGTIVIKEFFLDDDRIRPQQAALFSVNMLVGTESGQSYTLSETRAILEHAGFGGFETIDVAMHSKLLVGRLA